MTDTYRALCAELTEELHEHTCLYEGHESELVLRARAALAQPEPARQPTFAKLLMPPPRSALARPEPVAPTDEEIGEWHDQCADLTRLGKVDHYWAFDFRSDEVAGVVRAALARWGTPANTINQEDYDRG
jgi:hypothetical protein